MSFLINKETTKVIDTFLKKFAGPDFMAIYVPGKPWEEISVFCLVHSQGLVDYMDNINLIIRMIGSSNCKIEEGHLTPKDKNELMLECADLALTSFRLPHTNTNRIKFAKEFFPESFSENDFIDWLKHRPEKNKSYEDEIYQQALEAKDEVENLEKKRFIK